MIEQGAGRHQRLRDLCETLINTPASDTTLRPEVLELVELLSSTENAYRLRRDDLSSGETLTDQGLALSPANAAICAEDFMRTLKFMRGLHAAISDLQEKVGSRAVRVLYAGTGPYALLAIPAMLLFDRGQVRYTLIDRHRESIRSLEAVLDGFGLMDRVEACREMDIAEYRAEPDFPPDIILMEILQSALSKEPQVAMARHLLAQVPSAVMVPEEIAIDLELVDIGREVSLISAQGQTPPLQRDRVALGRVFSLTGESVRQWSGISGPSLPAANVTCPQFDGAQYELMLFTRIRVYGEHCLDDYASGLTYPRRLELDGELCPGDTIQFRYALGDRPRLLAQLQGPPSSAA